MRFLHARSTSREITSSSTTRICVVNEKRLNKMKHSYGGVLIAFVGFVFRWFFPRQNFDEKNSASSGQYTSSRTRIVTVDLQRSSARKKSQKSNKLEVNAAARNINHAVHQTSAADTPTVCHFDLSLSALFPFMQINNNGDQREP